MASLDQIYATIRVNAPTLPEKAPKEMTAYLTTLADIGVIDAAHDAALSKITDTHAQLVAKLDQSAPTYSDDLARLTSNMDELIDAENEKYNDAITEASEDRDEAFARLPANLKAALGSGMADDAAPSNVANTIAAYLAGLTPEQKEMLTDLDGHNASTSIEIAVGYITKNRFLQVPASLKTKLENAWDTQLATPACANVLDSKELLSMALVNLSCFKDIQGAEFFALLRAQIAAIVGIPSSVQKSLVRYHEVTIVQDPTDVTQARHLITWMSANKVMVKSLRYFAINFIGITNHVLLTLRSHYKPDPSFENLWSNAFRGALMDNLLSAFAYDKTVLLHDVIHPWGLRRPYDAHVAFVAKDICDNSVKLRLKGASCGTAAYTGGAALLDQMRATKLFDNFFRARRDEVQRVQTIAEDIKNNRPKYCLNRRFYGESDVINLPEADLAVIAPIVLAYRDVFLKTTSFKDVKAITKVAANSDGVRKILVAKIKQLIKADQTSIQDIV